MNDEKRHYRSTIRIAIFERENAEFFPIFYVVQSNGSFFFEFHFFKLNAHRIRKKRELAGGI